VAAFLGFALAYRPLLLGGRRRGRESASLEAGRSPIYLTPQLL
jgi:hypothetical protein